MESVRKSNRSSSVSKERKKKIVVTGYGSFGHFAVNPAEVIVENLADYEFPPDLDVQTEILPVSYRKANECSTKHCESTRPDFIVHVGVNGRLFDSINIEEQAFSHGYWSPDIHGEVPLLNRSIVELRNDEPRILKTRLDCDLVATKADGLFSKIEVETSDDPGRYLCGYIYYLSLHKSNGRALFVHVCPFSEEATEERMTELVAEIVRLVGEQI